ncbi:MAG: GH3 auxin-responsive promoter family protein [Verrucomicrobia bacterium]|nr:GH3 auxin-responsive promoter family protein [Verrucomicrobiota bacterium]
MIRRIVNRVWVAACARELRRFEEALQRLEEVQNSIVLANVRRNADTAFGRAHGFSDIRTVGDFQERVPISGHAAYAESVAEIARGATGVLTTDPVSRLLPTSGSTSGSKLVPWTAMLGREFRRGIDPWIAALYTRHPGLLDSKAYWSISPPGPVSGLQSVIPVGFEDDSAYLGFAGRWVYGRVSVIPEGISNCRNPMEFRDRTVLALLGEPDLGLVSVWSPTFFSLLLDHFESDPERLISNLANRHPKRADSLRRIIAETDPAGWWRRIWPRLRVLSCWTHGPSETTAARLAERLPGVVTQGKGLLATEAFVSLPLADGMDPVLAANSHFYEFVETATGVVRLAHELDVGVIYRVVVTTGGGLYRYDLGDLVRVTGRIGPAPCFRFVGREGNVADLCGEKLHGPVVGEVLAGLLERHGIRARFHLLAPEDTGGPPRYVWFVETGSPPPEGLADELDTALSDNFHYAHCRRLGQLAHSAVFWIDPAATSGAAVYQDVMLSRGMRAGDIKLAPLDASTGWGSRFSGHPGDAAVTRTPDTGRQAARITS